MSGWTMPKKDDGDWYSERIDDGGPMCILSAQGNASVSDESTVPSGVMLAVLAAEANERAGWDWVLARYEHGSRATAQTQAIRTRSSRKDYLYPSIVWEHNAKGVRLIVDGAFQPEAYLSVLHGLTLLEEFVGQQKPGAGDAMTATVQPARVIVDPVDRRFEWVMSPQLQVRFEGGDWFTPSPEWFVRTPVARWAMWAELAAQWAS